MISFPRWLISVKDMHPDDKVRCLGSIIADCDDTYLDMKVDLFFRRIFEELLEAYEEECPGFAIGFVNRAFEIFKTSYIPSLYAHLN